MRNKSFTFRRRNVLMAPCMRASGRAAGGTDREGGSGKMAVNTKANGRRERWTDRGNEPGLIELVVMASGRTIRWTDSGRRHFMMEAFLMERCTMDIGKMGRCTGKEL